MSVFGDSNAKRIIDELRAEVEKMASQRDEWRERAIERGNERDVAEKRAIELRAEVERMTKERDDALRAESERGALLAAANRALVERRERAEAAEAELARLRPVVEAAEELWGVTVVAGDDAAVASEALMKFGEAVDVFRRAAEGGDNNE